jgi:hypothetical protein
MQVVDFIRNIAQDERVDQVIVRRSQSWEWVRDDRRPDARLAEDCYLMVKPNTKRHGTKDGIPAGEAYRVADLKVKDGEVLRCDIATSAPYALGVIVRRAFDEREVPA